MSDNKQAMELLKEIIQQIKSHYYCSSKEYGHGCIADIKQALALLESEQSENERLTKFLNAELACRKGWQESYKELQAELAKAKAENAKFYQDNCDMARHLSAESVVIHDQQLDLKDLQAELDRLKVEIKMSQHTKQDRMGLPNECGKEFPDGCSGCPEHDYCLGYAHGQKDNLSEIATAKEALKKYGGHKPECILCQNHTGVISCDCGYDQATLKT